MAEALARDPILVTALNPIHIGYERAAAIAKRAYKEKRAVLDVALEMDGLAGSEAAQVAGSRSADEGRDPRRRGRRRITRKKSPGV